ncbi:MAG: ParB N-terminal domain-containing protein [Candidatus Paceibacterota bacterium]|jgi:hypothetical protein
MKIQKVELKRLTSSAQPRPLITDAVDRLASSIREVGLIQPITVQPCSMMIGGLSDHGFQIVAGHHRVAACRALGWEEIDALVVEPEEHLQAELMEIDENLCRAELTATQRTAHIKRRKQIWEALHPVEIQVGQLVPPEIGYGKPPPQSKAFAADTAKVTGESKRDVNRHLARAEALGDDLGRIVGTSLDKGVELDALAKLPEPERKELIDRAEAGEKVSARQQQADPPKKENAALLFAEAIGAALDSFRASLRCYSDEAAAAAVSRGVGAADENDLERYFRVIRRIDDFLAAAESEVE